MDPPRSLTILCLDSGGVRGLSSLLILRRLMQKLGRARKPIPNPYEVFDVICGTSTGGLIALMLGRLRMPVDEAIISYLNLSENVFGKTIGSWSGNGVLYDASILEKCVKNTVAEQGYEQDSALLDPSNNRCRTFVVASSTKAEPVIFRSYLTLMEATTCSIWQAARATTAVSAFFEPITFGSSPETFVDGGFAGANNPSELAYRECKGVFPGREIGCFLSIGAGAPNITSFTGNRAKIAKACSHISRSCQRVAEEVAQKFQCETPDGQMNPYFRFSVDKDLEKVELDEWNQLAKETDIVEAYMISLEEEVRKCVEVLRVRVG